MDSVQAAGDDEREIARQEHMGVAIGLVAQLVTFVFAYKRHAAC